MNITEGRQIAPFVGVDRVVDGKVSTVTVPGHDGRDYKVSLDRGKAVTYYCPCKGAGKSVCYHGIAAVIKAAGEKGYTISWTDSEGKAKRLANLGGRVFSLKSKRSGKVLWGVMKGKSTPIQVEMVVRPRFMRNRPSIWAPSMRVKGSYPEPISPHDRSKDIWVYVKPGEIAIGNNLYHGFSKESYKRVHRVLDSMWKRGDAYPIMPEGCHGWCVMGKQ